MIFEKILMPYILSTQHTIVHMGQLATSLMIYSNLLNSNTSSDPDIAITEWCIRLNMANNFICIILQESIHYLTRRMYLMYIYTEAEEKQLKEKGKHFNFSFLS